MIELYAPHYICALMCVCAIGGKLFQFEALIVLSVSIKSLSERANCVYTGPAGISLLWCHGTGERERCGRVYREIYKSFWRVHMFNTQISLTVWVTDMLNIVGKSML